MAKKEKDVDDILADLNNEEVEEKTAKNKNDDNLFTPEVVDLDSIGVDPGNRKAEKEKVEDLLKDKIFKFELHERSPK